jgi:2-methylcitrate dehydratase PrpD
MLAVRQLADYVASAREQPLSAEAREAALRCILDLLAATAVGVGAPGVAAVRQVARASYGAGEFPLWFTGESGSLIGSIWANCAAAAALDLDDGNRLARGHPGAAIIPAAFAVAQERGASLDELLSAIAIGYEVGVAVGAARRFYANSGMWTCYGVVAAAGALRRLPPAQLAHAFAIAGMSAPNQLHAGGGPAQLFPIGSDVKEGIPWSTITALQAASLAEAGHTGPENLLDSEAHFAVEDMLAGLGHRLHIGQSYFKFYSCCRHIHPPVDALRGLIARHHLDAARIEAIEVHSYSGALRLANPPEPANFVDVQFSIPYCLGLVALHGSETLLPLTPGAFGRADVVAFARKVSLHLDPALDRRFPTETLARLVVTHGGERHESPATAPHGEASAPASWQELEEKLLVASRFVATPDQQRSILAAVSKLRAGDMAPLKHALATLALGQHARAA